MKKAKTHYEALGVDPGAPAEALKRAHRKAAAEHHPDKGGDAEAFLAVQRAYEVLSDPAAKANYDRFGEAGGGKDPQAESAQQVAKLLVDLLEKSPDDADVVAMAKAHLEATLAELKHQDDRAAKREARLRRRAARLKGPPGSLAHQLIDGILAGAAAQAQQRAYQQELGRGMLAALGAYRYEQEQPEPEGFLYRKFNITATEFKERWGDQF